MTKRKTDGMFEKSQKTGKTMNRTFWKIKSDRENGGYILYDDEGREISTPDLDSAIFLIHSLNRKHKEAFEEPPITDKLRVPKSRDK